MTPKPSRRERNGEGPPRGAVVGSFALHAAVLAVVMFLGSGPVIRPVQTVRVRMVAAAPEDLPVRVDPAPPRVEEEEHRPPPPEPSPRPRPQTETPAVEEEEIPQPVEPEEEPARTEEVGEEPVNVQLEGATFAFPEYMKNIIRQVQRYWRPPAGGRALRAEVAFTIHRDGSVSAIEWVRRSGDPSFDLVAKGAIEAAGNSQAFGPLPEGYPRDALRVSFYFDPSRR
ncbi:MAG: TonB C-terminal domain-containing protein [Gemmatimonadota bacterium]